MSPAYYIVLGLVFVGVLVFLDLYRRKLRLSEDDVLKQSVQGQLFSCILIDGLRVSGIDVLMGGAVGAAGLGAMKFGAHRAARAYFKDGQFLVDTIDPNNVSRRMLILETPTSSISHAMLLGDSIKSQLGRILKLGGIAGISFGLLISLLVLSKLGFDHEKMLFVLAFGVAAGGVLGLLFAVVPNLARLRSGRSILRFLGPNDTVVGCIGVEREHRSEAQRVLTAVGIPCEDVSAATDWRHKS